MDHSNEEEELSLRDKFAISVLQALLTNETLLVQDFVNIFDSKDEEDTNRKSYCNRLLDRRIRAAYRIADMMRKARLATFE